MNAMNRQWVFLASGARTPKIGPAMIADLVAMAGPSGFLARGMAVAICKSVPKLKRYFLAHGARHTLDATCGNDRDVVERWSAKRAGYDTLGLGFSRWLALLRRGCGRAVERKQS